MTTTEAPVVPDHPATYSRAVLDRLRDMLAPERDRVGTIKVLDPFAGVGGIHQLAEQHVQTFGVELQPEWARAHPDTICGDVLELGAMFPAGTFDVIATSPCYGNRMADSHQATDPCRTCDGLGATHDVDGSPGPVCTTCKGSGLTHRNTYAHALRRAGAEPVAADTNAQVMQWGPAYRDFHDRAWRSCDHVLRPGGLVLLNVKNHVRVHRVQRVVEFHLTSWLVMGYTLDEARHVPTKGLPFGANHDVRTPGELVLALRKAER